MKSKIAIVTPVFNDWVCLKHLISDISKSLEGKVETIHLVAVNDCSTEMSNTSFDLGASMTFEQLNLITNVGHQRAILIGLCHCLEQQLDVDYVVVMDSDGEDNPKYILELLEQSKGFDNKVVFAKRSKRSEKFSFKLFYKLYKIFFRLLTGKSISFGNFSCIPKSVLPRICNEPNFWNHYSSAMIKSKISFERIDTERSKRYAGTTKMNINSLILHGLSSISVYVESIIVRILKLNFVIFLLLVCCGLVVLYVRLTFSDSF